MRIFELGRLRVLPLVLIVASCTHSPHTGLRRIALLPGNVLAPNAPDWVREAVPVVLQRDLSRCNDVLAVLAGSDSDAYKSGASEALEATIDSIDDRYSVSAGLRSLTTQRIAQMPLEEQRAGLISALDSVAKGIDSHAVVFPTQNEAALGAYVSALEATDSAARLQSLREAVGQAPDFGAAQIELIAAEAQTGAADLQDTIATAQRQRNRFDQLDRARLDALLGEIAARPLAEQTAAEAAVIKLAPNDPDMLANLARDRFLLGDGVEGERYLRRATELRGNTPQLQVQLLRGLVETRQFSRAGQMLGQQTQTAASALEQASCWLLAGDVAKADAIAASAFRAQHTGDPLATLRRAEWMAAKGDLAGAAALAANPATGDADANAAGQGQAAIWYLKLGRRAEARQLAESSTHGAANAGAKQMAEVAWLLATSDGGTQLRAGLSAANARGPGRDTVLAFGLFLYGDYAAAAEAWRATYTASGERDLQSCIMLAACYARMNQNAKATALHVEPVLPNLTGADPFATITFGEMRRLLRL